MCAWIRIYFVSPNSQTSNPKQQSLNQIRTAWILPLQNFLNLTASMDSTDLWCKTQLQRALKPEGHQIHPNASVTSNPGHWWCNPYKKSDECFRTHREGWRHYAIAMVLVVLANVHERGVQIWHGDLCVNGYEFWFDGFDGGPSRSHKEPILFHWKFSPRSFLTHQ